MLRHRPASPIGASPPRALTPGARREDQDRPTRRARHWIRGATVGVLLYTLAVLGVVSYYGDTGLHCVFATKIREVPEAGRWASRPDLDRAIAPAELQGPAGDRGTFSPVGPRANGEDVLVMLGGHPVRHYTDYVRAQRKVHAAIDRYVEVRWQSPQGPRFGFVQVLRPPASRFLLSTAWFLQEILLIYATGAWVYWRRPKDDSARVFFALCIVTAIAYMGGYHWGQIAKFPPLIFVFAAFVVFVPVVSLHFYLIFPRENPVFARHRRLCLGAMYGIPAATAVAIWVTMIVSRWGQAGASVEAALEVLKYLALGYIALSAAVFLLCLACLFYSYFRPELTRAEQNQVRWILLATFLALLPIAWLLRNVAVDPAQLGLMRSAWPMFAVSLLYTAAYALSITRYKLMQAEQLFNRGKVYVAVSMGAGLLYSGGLVVGALILGDALKDNQASLGAVVACVTALVLLSLSGAARRWFQSALDRRFHREKYKFDQAMRKMSLAVGNLVDRGTLGRRLLDAASEVLRVEWGTLYLGQAGGGPLGLVACVGPEPDDRQLDPDNPLIERLALAPAPIRIASVLGPDAAAEAATDAMIALGGEVAVPLEADGHLVGLILLGPKRSGLPYEEEEVAFLSALGSVSVLALRSADIQQTLEVLNRELSEKVEKIAEQQRRIYILQDQLAGRSRGRAVLEDDAEGPAPADGPAATAAGLAAIPTAFAAIRGTGPAVRQLIHMARKVAASPSAVLVRGESGTGKELLAEAIHRSSPRADRAFVKVHCAALSQNLLESELFGHVKGAFTDARSDRIGRFQQADGGTLFLDEIGDINLEVQTKLLRVLQEMQFEKVGSSQTIQVDVRIIAATHQDLEALMRAGKFREDLYYRLNVISLRTPSLRERREDVFELAVHFLNEQARRLGKPVTQLEDAAVEVLTAYDWPGNIRELENVMQRAVVLSDGPAVTVDDLPAEVRRGGPSPRRGSPVAVESLPARPRRRAAVPRAGRDTWSGPVAALTGPVAAPATTAATAATEGGLDAEFVAYERRRLLDCLDEAAGNKSEAARLFGVPRSTFFSKLRKHGLA